MKKKLKAFAVILLTTAVFGCDSVKRNNKQAMTTVDQVNVERFQGTWHVAARMPSFFEKDCKNSSATYTPTSDPKVIAVVNECDSISDPGTRDAVEGTGTIQDSSNAKLKIRLNRFPGNLGEGDYWVINKDENYNWVIVSEPKGRYLWIMGRDKIMDESLLAELVAWIEADGWDTSFLIYDNY